MTKNAEPKKVSTIFAFAQQLRAKPENRSLTHVGVIGRPLFKERRNGFNLIR